MRSWAEPALATVLALALAGCGDRPPPTAPVGRVEAPRAVRTPPPDYPEVLACNDVGGIVDLRVTIGPDGRVGQVRVQRSSGNAQLDQAAAAGVRNWEFVAATQGGKPVESTISVPMTFNVPKEKPQRCFALQGQAG